MKRIAFARIAQETNALSPVATTLGDFDSAHYVTGERLLHTPEVPGFFRKAELTGFVDAARERKGEIEPVPISSAWASSGGPLATECFETLEERLIEGLKAAGPIDGMYMCLHGAMGARGVIDPETRILRSIREVIGNVPLVVSHDLHGNLTRARIDQADAIVGYQTNPHRDHFRIGRKAGRIVIGTVLGEIKPTVAWRTLPMILGGGNTIDFLNPMRPVFKKMKRAERHGVLAASTFMVHPWNDSPGLGWSTCVVTDNDMARADQLADELAEMCWERRHQQPPEFPTPEQAIASARAASWRRKLGVVVMADASDVVTAGAPGDSTHLLRALLEHGSGMLSYAAVRDPDAISRLWNNEAGDVVATTIGGSLDPTQSPPLPVRGTIVSKHARVGFGRTIVLAVEHLRVVVSEGPAMVMRPSFYTEVGLNLWKADIAIVKNFFPFLMFFLPYSRKYIFVRTQGRTDFDAAFALPFDGPVHPRDQLDDWRDRDHMRRAISVARPASGTSHTGAHPT